MTDGHFDMEIVHSDGTGPQWKSIKYCWSGIYGWRSLDLNRNWVWYRDWQSVDDEEFDDRYHSTDDSKWGDDDYEPKYYYPADDPEFCYDYYVCKMVAKDAAGNMDKSLGWVEIWFYPGEYYCDGGGTGGHVEPSVYVYDSEGNFYYVDLTLE